MDTTSPARSRTLLASMGAIGALAAMTLAPLPALADDTTGDEAQSASTEQLADTEQSAPDLPQSAQGQPALLTRGGETPQPCQSNAQGALIITATCVDDLFAAPVIDSREDRTTPVTAHVISGHFEGTDHRFTFVFPAQGWDGRFFQYTHPVTGNTLTDETIAFGAASGGYTVQATGQGGYRHLAAAAKLSRTYAAEYYGVDASTIHGYLYGPSGGSFQTIGATENTTGVWDGTVPIVMGNATSIPNNFFIRAMARLVLADDAVAISEAVITGSDPYAGLDEASAAMLEEMTALGVPLSGWDLPNYLLGFDFEDGGLGFGGVVKAMDPTYVDDFWTKPGYLGTEASPLGEVVRAALVDGQFTVSAVHTDGGGAVISVTLSGFPASASVEGVELTLLDANSNTVGSLSATIDATTGVLTLKPGNEDAVLAALQVGSVIDADNRWDIALRSYYRHQIPPVNNGFLVYDRFRSASGEPLYPQRAINVPAMMARSISGGAAYSGVFDTKVILVSNLQDVDAYPIHADWYARRIASVVGDDALADHMRIYYNENADHLEGGVTGAKAVRVVPHDPMVRQALRDLAAWVEDGVAPPASSVYTISSGQVSVPADTSRAGIQPVISLSTSVAAQPTAPRLVKVNVGQSVTFTASAAAPAGTGSLTGIDWDVTGTGEWISPSALSATSGSASLTHAFMQAGTYDITARVSLTRSGAADPFTTITNLATVRVVVSEAPAPDPDPDGGSDPDGSSASTDTGTNGAAGKGSSTSAASRAGLARTGVSAGAGLVVAALLAGLGTALVSRFRTRS